MAVEVAPAKRLFTRKEYHRIDGAGSVGPAAFPDVTLTLAEIFA